MKAKEIMTSDPLCCLPKTGILNAVQILRQFDIGFLPVINDVWNRELIGVVTDRDLCLSMLAEPHDPNLAKVRDCMATDVVSCSPDTDIREILARMVKHRIRRIPVVDRENSVLAVIGMSDIIRHKSAVDSKDIRMALSRITKSKRIEAEKEIEAA